MILESNKQNSLQLPFEYHHLPEDGPQFFKSGNLLTITDMVGVVLCTSGYIKIKTGLGQYDLKKKDILFNICVVFKIIAGCLKNIIIYPTQS